jgi:hypothetical protein
MHHTAHFIMKKTIFLSSVLFVMILSFAEGQTLRFKVIQSSNFQGIAHVEIKSSFDRTFYSDSTGHFEIQYKDHDTLTLSKAYYHTIHYLIEAKNFDASHTITLSMTADAEGNHQSSSDINTLQKFEYHFIHDQAPENNYLKIHVMEHTPGVNARTGAQKEFKIGSIPLEHSTLKSNKTGAHSTYQLK